MITNGNSNMLLRIVGSSKGRDFGSLHFLVLLWSTLKRLVNPHKNSCKEQVPTGETVKKICDIEKVINYHGNSEATSHTEVLFSNIPP